MQFVSKRCLIIKNPVILAKKKIISMNLFQDKPFDMKDVLKKAQSLVQKGRVDTSLWMFPTSLRTEKREYIEAVRKMAMVEGDDEMTISYLNDVYNIPYATLIRSHPQPDFVPCMDLKRGTLSDLDLIKSEDRQNIQIWHARPSPETYPFFREIVEIP